MASGLPRALLRGRSPIDIDAFLLALGARSFDFAAYHPHPPYHPLSMAATKALAPWLGPAAALTWLSITAVAVLAAAVYAVGRGLGGRVVGLYAAALVGLSPLVTQNGGVSLTYASEAAATAVVAALALHARGSPTVRAWALLGAAASVAVGLRPSAAIAAGPLLLWATWRRWRGLGVAAAVGAGATLAWLVPTLVAGGGWGDFQYGNRYQTRVFVLHDPVWEGGWDAARNHLAWLAHHLRAELPWLGAVGLVALCACLPLWLRRGPHRGLLLAWAGPTLLFYGLVYGGWPLFHSGYALALLPPAVVAGAVALRNVHAAVRDAVDERGLRAAAAVVLAAMALSPLSWASAWDERLADRRAADAWQDSMAGLEEALPPERTALLGSYAIHWALLEHPAYLSWVVGVSVREDGLAWLQVQQVRGGVADQAYFDDVRDGPHDPPHPIPDWVQEIALIEGHPGDAGGSVTDAAPKRVVDLPGGARLVVLDARAASTVEELVRGNGEPFPVAGRAWPP